MIKTQRIEHIKSIPSSGIVECPSCHTLVNIHEEYCPKCGQIVNYLFNIEALKKWSLDLFNFDINHISNGMANYSCKWSGEHYHNFYSIEEGCNQLPDTFSSYYISYNNGYFVIRKGLREYGLLDKKGNTIISPVCDYIDFVDDLGHFIVSYNGKVGVNDTKNHNIIPIEYESIKRSSIFNNFYFVVEKDKKFGIIDFNNQCIIPVGFDSIGEYRGDGFVPVCNNNRWGYYDPEKNRIVIPLKFDKAQPFWGNSAKVCLGGTELFIDKEGFPTIPNRQIVENGKVVVRDCSGHLIQEMIFDPKQVGMELRSFAVDGKVGAIYPDGSFAIKPIYDELYLNHQKGDLHAAKKDNKWGVINTKGEIIIPFRFNQTIISEGLIRIEGFKDPTKRWQPYTYGFIDRWDNVVIPQVYDKLNGFYEGLCLYNGPKSDQVGIMDKFGNYVEYHPVIVNGKYVQT